MELAHDLILCQLGALFMTARAFGSTEGLWGKKGGGLCEGFLTLTLRRPQHSQLSNQWT